MWRLASTLFALAFSAAPVPAGIHVVDGDTIVVGREPIRMVGIDAPETHQARCGAELRLGLAAKARVVELLTAACGPLAQADAEACLAIERRPRPDRYGRTLARIRVGGRDLGEALVAEGLARRYLCPGGRCPARQPWCGRSER